jgi:hypothetical protein
LQQKRDAGHFFGPDVRGCIQLLDPLIQFRRGDVQRKRRRGGLQVGSLRILGGFRILPDFASAKTRQVRIVNTHLTTSPGICSAIHGIEGFAPNLRDFILVKATNRWRR